jgi:branched-chain amino acid transport system permease protein
MTLVATFGVWIATAPPPTPVEATRGGGLERFIYTLGLGITQGAIYALVALGFVLVFKATQTVNFAQGAMALVTAWFFSMVLIDWRIPGRWLGDNDYVVWFSALVVGLVVAIVIGLVIERLIIRPMIGEPLFSIAVITLGLEAALRTVGTDALLNTRGLSVPWGRDSFEIGGATIYWSWIFTAIAAALAFVGVFLFFRTRTGVAMRAVAFDQEAALAQGISVGRVFAIAWGAGTALALVAALCFSMSPPSGNGVVTAGIGGLALRALPAVILGGLDSVQGALAGGLTIGLAEIFAGSYLSGYTETLGTGYALVVPYVAMLLVLLVRPYGLFGTPEIRRV